MGNVIIKGTEETIFFSAANYYGANMKVDVFDDEQDEFIVNNVPMTELVEPITAFDTTVVGDTATDTKVIMVNDVSGFTASDRVDIGGEIYRITNVDAGVKSIALHRGLVKDSLDGDAVSKTGHMGIFKIKLIVTRNGYFVIKAKDTKFGLQKSDSLTIKDQSLEDMFEFTNTQVNENERIIKETSSWSIII